MDFARCDSNERSEPESHLVDLGLKVRVLESSGEHSWLRKLRLGLEVMEHFGVGLAEQCVEILDRLSC